MPVAGLSLNSRLRASADVSLPELYGSVVYNHTFTSSNQPVGLYKIDRTTTSLKYEGINANYGGVAVDGVYYVTEYFDFLGTPIVQVVGYDLATGENVSSTSGSIENVAIGGLTYDPTTGKCYGITFNADGSSMQLTEMEYGPSGVTATAVAPISGSWISLACDAQGQLYGISYQVSGSGQTATTVSSTLHKIDKRTGATTLVGTTGQLPQYLTGAAIDPISGRMFWCVSPADDSGLLCEVNLSTGAATVIGQFENGDEVCGLFVDAPAAQAGAPAAVSGLTVNFLNGALSGTVDFTAPSTLFDGTAASGALSYKVMANGASVAEGKTEFGTKVSAPVTLSAAGSYTFTVTVSNEVGDSPRADVSAFVGNGVPVAPVATLTYAGGKMRVSWSAVTMSADGGYIDPAAIRYTVTRYPDGEVVADKIAGTSFEEAVSEPDTFTSYSYGVKAQFEGLSSAESMTGSVGLGSLRPPFSNSFEGASSLDGYTIVDANADNVKWEYVDGAVAISYNTMSAMNDWLITPPVKVEAGKVYSVSLRASCYDPKYVERIEVCWGTAAAVDAMTNTVVSPTELVSNEYVTLSGLMKPTADGLAYIGIHGISDADKYVLFVDDLTVSKGVGSEAPGAATDINVVSDSHGAYKATVSFKAPELTAGGAALSSLDKIELSRDGVLIHTFNNPTPGLVLSYEDNVGAEGYVDYTIVAYNTAGAGSEASYRALIGIGQPAAPANVKVTEDVADDGMVTVTWDPVTSDINGNPVDASLISYIVA
ncbi:MAG: choice-of-anchor J domain-containing protein, partial [Muribaculaceae bacterium]|nr:choice-of-anchor J domain-containing protein [Muribaculaceae bacterium]